MLWGKSCFLNWLFPSVIWHGACESNQHMFHHSNVASVPEWKTKRRFVGRSRGTPLLWEQTVGTLELLLLLQSQEHPDNWSKTPAGGPVMKTLWASWRPKCSPTHWCVGLHRCCVCVCVTFVHWQSQPGVHGAPQEARQIKPFGPAKSTCLRRVPLCYCSVVSRASAHHAVGNERLSLQAHWLSYPPPPPLCPSQTSIIR